MLDNQEPFGQIGNVGTGETKYSIVEDDENPKSSRNSVIPDFMSRTMADDEILESISSLNSKQRDGFNIFNKWTK